HPGRPMSLRQAVERIWAWVERWFTTPVPRAAGRMGIFRVLFGLAYLWHLSIFDASLFGGLPAGYQSDSIWLSSALPFDPTAAQLRWLDSLLVGALVLLIVGLRTQAVTAVVLVAGVLREAVLSGVGAENGNVFLVFHLPLFMLLVGRWGSTHSIDARRVHERGGRPVDPADDAWPSFLAARANLVILAVLFSSSALFKTLSGGTWLTDRHLLVNLMLEESIESARTGAWSNPIAPWVASHPVAGFALQLMVLSFEGLFVLALLHPLLRSFFLSAALVFHSVNALFMTVSFTPILIVYALFVDWQAALDRIRRLVPPPPKVPDRMLVPGALALAALLAITWRHGPEIAFNLGGRIDWRTVWLPVLPLAVVATVVSGTRVVRHLAGRGRPAPGG
ncbi:MAG: hypothetical protein Q8K72_18795, partial [Acidimicrobiales bacterium]|nr:hypothetical protein [Acidimicrobiales bacterium]